MKDLATGVVYIAMLFGVYCWGYARGAENTLVHKAGDLAIKINNGVETLEKFPKMFGEKVDAAMTEIKSWFKWKRGRDGKIYGEIVIDPGSPMYNEIDGLLRDAERVREPDSRPSP